MATLQQIFRSLDPNDEDLRLIMQAKLADPKFSFSTSQRKSLKTALNKYKKEQLALPPSNTCDFLPSTSTSSPHFSPQFSPKFSPQFSPQFLPQSPTQSSPQLEQTDSSNKEDFISSMEAIKIQNEQILTALKHQNFSIDGFFACKYHLTVNYSKLFY